MGAFVSPVRVAIVALTALAATLLLAEEAAAARGECFADPVGDVVDADRAPVADAGADRADVVDYCVDFRADRAVFAVRLADQADPRQDPNWHGIHHLIWSVVGSGEQLDGDLVAHDGPVPYAVRFFPDGPEGDELGTLLEEPGPGEGQRLCDGEASYEDGWLVSEFPVGADSACFAGEDRLAVNVGTSFDSDDGGVRLDQAPDEETRFRGFVARGDGSGQLPTACGDREVPAAGFTDVDPATVHAVAVECVAWYQVAHGTSPSTYSPAVSVNRAQMASFLARVVDTSDAVLPPGESRFADVAGSPHADNIERLAAAGIVQGTTEGDYHPGALVRRDQMASFLVRAFEFVVDYEVAAGDTGFGDIDGNVHETNIAKAATAGFTRGTTPTTYSPGQDVRRDQMASFLTRTLDLLVADGRVLPPAASDEPPAEEVPDPLVHIQHGGRYWGVYWIGEDPDLDEVRAAIEQRWGPVWTDGDLGCDRGAPEAFDADPSARRVAVYFHTEAQARQFAEHADLPSEPAGYAEVTTGCLD